ncbi:recombinase family protein [Nonomuraea turkmeniaca]|uniref:recombinase family protein n=1 Tax=Nonomuraea turkmeniaca TaxID=103838 RepID=UPI001FE9F951|nr:recombinase family protein [Nonomuraea turkmeniaca]
MTPTRARASRTTSLPAQPPPGLRGGTGTTAAVQDLTGRTVTGKVFEEKISGKLATDDRPDLLSALGYIREGDLLTVREVDRLGRNLLEGLIVLNDLFQQGLVVKVLEGIAAGEHTERSLVLDIVLALAEDRRRDIIRKTKNGLDPARARGRVGGRPPLSRTTNAPRVPAVAHRSLAGRPVALASSGEALDLPVVHIAYPLPAGLGRWADPRVTGNMALTQGEHVRPIQLDPCVYLIGSAD